MSRPTMDDVAARAGVSRALVSLVINESPKVSAAKRQAVLTAADELGYRPNRLARNLAARRTHTIGVVLNDLHNPFLAEVIDGLEAAAEERLYRLLMLNGGRDARREAAAVEAFLELQTDGIVAVGPILDDDALVSAAAHAPVVAVGRRIDHPDVDSIVTDDHRGGALAVEHLVSLGHRRITHIDGGTGAGAAERCAGYLTAMEDSGLGDHAEVVPGGFTDRSAFAAVDRLLTAGDRPTAIFAANDFAATGVIDRLDDAGLRVPEDLSVVGYDNTNVSALHHVSLTTIDQPRATMGELAATALFDRIENERTDPIIHILEPTLVVRSTSAAPATGGVARMRTRTDEEAS